MTDLMRVAARGLSPQLIACTGAGLALLDDRARTRLAAFVAGARAREGGFRGRSGEPDLYYAPFGFALARECKLPPAPADTPYLEQFGDGAGLDAVHWAALARARAALGTGESSKGWTPGAADVQALGVRAREAVSGGPYAAFLALLAAEALGVVPPAGRLLPRIKACRAEDGSYRAASSGAGTVPVTAAAIAVFWAAGRSAPDDAARYLEAMRHPRGGWTASRDAPEPDLLSTAVALFALRLAGRAPADDPMSIVRFIEGHWREDGGCSGHPDDPTSDVEYTWYALLALGAILPAG